MVEGIEIDIAEILAGRLPIGKPLPGAVQYDSNNRRKSSSNGRSLIRRTSNRSAFPFCVAWKASSRLSRSTIFSNRFPVRFLWVFLGVLRLDGAFK